MTANVDGFNEAFHGLDAARRAGWAKSYSLERDLATARDNYDRLRSATTALIQTYAYRWVLHGGFDMNKKCTTHETYGEMFWIDLSRFRSTFVVSCLENTDEDDDFAVAYLDLINIVNENRSLWTE